jgi:hypothetical protein
MTKMNWEKANTYSKFIKQTGSGSYTDDGPENGVFDLSNPKQNPLGLRLEDLDGRILDNEKRLAIVKHLIRNDDAIRRHYKLEEFDAPGHRIPSKKFAEFCNRTFSASLDWPNDRCPVPNALAYEACFAYAYLHEHNKRVSKEERAEKFSLAVKTKVERLTYEETIAVSKLTDSNKWGEHAAAALAQIVLDDRKSEP